MAGIELLTAKAVEGALRAARESAKAGKITDGGGLYLEVKPSGTGWWRLRYWMNGRENRLSLGTYPEITLARARERRREILRDIAEGIDPSDKRKAEKAQREAASEAQRLADAGLPGPESFEYIARDWHARIHSAKVVESHAARTLARLEQNVFPWLGRRPIREIEPPDLLACLRRIEDRGAIETAHRTKDACGQVFRYAIASGQAVRNPAADLRDALMPVPVRHFAAITDPDGAGALLRNVMGYQGHPVTVAALKLSALLLLRPGELRHMEWAWVDADAAMLTIPSDVMKRSKAEKLDGAPHLVPLAPQALTVLKELKSLTGAGRFVFPSLLTVERCMSENTVRSALRRMGYGNDDMTAHGFRAMARTLIAERLNVAPEVIEAQLAHAVPDALGRAYNRTQYLEQRRDMMARWADYLDALREAPTAGEGRAKEH